MLIFRALVVLVTSARSFPVGKIRRHAQSQLFHHADGEALAIIGRIAHSSVLPVGDVHYLTANAHGIILIQSVNEFRSQPPQENEAIINKSLDRSQIICL